MDDYELARVLKEYTKDFLTSYLDEEDFKLSKIDGYIENWINLYAKDRL